MGTMMDASRNGVLFLPPIKYLSRKLAVWGYNMLQLYTEDTYKIDGEPFFGYLRGGYSQSELVRMTTTLSISASSVRLAFRRWTILGRSFSGHASLHFVTPLRSSRQSCQRRTSCSTR